MTHPFGRRGFGPMQPPLSGSHYPFLRPSEDVQQLLGDLYLSYVDDDLNFVAPLSVKTLWGFETGNSDSLTGSGHDYDVLIVDAADATVFDSRTATAYAARDWFGRAEVICWSSAAGVCKIVRHAEWTAGAVADGLTVTFPDTLLPEDGTLHPSAYERQSPNLRRIDVGESEIEDREVWLVSGSNTLITPTRATGVDGRPVWRLEFDMSPGLGEGREQGCDDEDADTLAELQGARPDPRGVIDFEGDGCISFGRPESRDGAVYRFPVQRDEHTFSIYNDCEQACDADAYVRTYEGIRRELAFWKDLAERGVEMREQLYDLVARWQNEQCCREIISVRAVLRADGDCKISGGIRICNASGGELPTLRVTLYFESDDYQGGSFTCEARRTGRGEKFDVGPPYSHPAGGSWTMPGFKSGDAESVEFKVCLDDCEGTENLRAYVLVSFDDPENGYDYPVVDYPPGVTFAEPEAIPEPLRAWAATNEVTLNEASPYCEPCDCGGTPVEDSDSSSDSSSDSDDELVTWWECHPLAGVLEHTTPASEKPIYAYDTLEDCEANCFQGGACCYPDNSCTQNGGTWYDGVDTARIACENDGGIFTRGISCDEADCGGA